MDEALDLAQGFADLLNRVDRARLDLTRSGVSGELELWDGETLLAETCRCASSPGWHVHAGDGGSGVV